MNKTKIYITRGDDTNFNNYKFLTFNIDTEIDITGWSAVFTLGGVSYTFDNIESKTFSLVLSAEDTQKIPYGNNEGLLYFYDSDKRRKLVSNSIPFYVTKNPTGNVEETVSVEVPTNVDMNISINLGGSKQVTKTSELENDSGFITKDEDDLTYYFTSAEVTDLLKTKIDTYEKGVANGVATLNENGKVPLEQIDTESSIIKDNTVSTTSTYSSNKIEEIISTKANEDNVVHKTGDETISGDKTFNGNTALGGYFTTITSDYLDIKSSTTSMTIRNQGPYDKELETLIERHYTGDTSELNIGNAVQTINIRPNGATIATNQMTIYRSGKVRANGFIGELTGNADTATKAVNDGDGNNIVETYATKAELPTKLSELDNDTGYITITAIPTKISELNNDTGFITKDETDLTYYSTTTEINDLLKGKISNTEKGVADGVATLGIDSKIPLNQLKVIDDISIAETTTYSSNKINEELNKKADSSALNTISTSKADDTAVVHNTGAETISGTKTFTNDLTVASLILTNPITTISVNNETFIRNTSTGETIVSNLGTSTNSMCFRPNGTDNSEGQVLINKDGTITGNLTGNATTATQATNATNDSEGNSIVDTYANQEFSNLGEEAENRLTISKAYMADSIYTDTKLYNQLVNQKTKLAVSTGIDTIKQKNYILIGTPTVLEDGIANGFSNGNAIKTNVSVTPVNSIEIQGTFKYTEPTVTVVPYVVGSSRWRLDITKNNNSLSVYATNDLEVSTNTRFNISIEDAIEDGATIEIKDKISKTKREVQVIIGNSTYKGESTFTSEIPFTEIGVTIGSAALDGVSTYFWNSSVDLNTVKVYVDNNLHYQACLLIPYTSIKTGSKIVDSKYRERVFDMYEQEGIAMYYTLDTNEHNFTLPLGDIYGIIIKVLDKLKELGG